MQEIVNLEPQLGMTSILYCYGESKPRDEENDCHIVRVEVKEKDGEDRDAELVELVNQYMTPLTLEFEVLSEDNHYRCNDWADSCKHSGLSFDELEVEKKFRDKSECVNAVQQWHITKDIMCCLCELCFYVGNLII